MAKWSMGLALIGMCLTGTAEAQWGGAPPCREMAPGPMDRCTAPEGPTDELGIPAQLPNAFSDPCCDHHLDPYFYVGAQALMRHHMGEAAVGIRGAGAAAVVVQKFDDMPMNVNFGPSGGIGFRWDGGAFDLGGYYLPPKDSAITDFGAVNSAIPNVTASAAAGFFRTTLTSSLGNYEANFSSSSTAWQGPEWLLGVRFLDLEEKLRFQGGNTYTVRAFNRIVGPTVGVQYPAWVCGSCALLLYGKATWGWNMLHADGSTVTAGVVAEESDNRTFFSHIYEVGFTFDVQISDPLRLRLGWQGLWALHVAEAVKQIGTATGDLLSTNTQGSILYHGPMFQLEWVF